MVHGILASLAFVILFPTGAMIMRVFPSRHVIRIHAAFQVLAYLIYTASFAIGVHLVRTIRIGSFDLVSKAYLCLRTRLLTLSRRSYKATQPTIPLLASSFSSSFSSNKYSALSITRCSEGIIVEPLGPMAIFGSAASSSLLESSMADWVRRLLTTLTRLRWLMEYWLRSSGYCGWPRRCAENFEDVKRRRLLLRRLWPSKRIHRYHKKLRLPVLP